MVATAEFDAPVVTLEPGRLHLLPNPYPLDGRVCTHPLSLRGWANQNCYLFVEGGHAVLVDTGFSVHEAAMISRLRRLISPGMRLDVSVLRLGEFYGTCNVRPIIESFDVHTVFTSRADGVDATDYRPEYVPWLTTAGGGSFATVKKVKLKGDGQIDMGADRTLRMLRAPLRLLSTNWAYDSGTKTLLTADIFNHTGHESPQGPWVVGPDATEPTVEQIREFLVGTRYWWLPGARTAPIVSDLRKLFDEVEVERIAPGFGQVLEGADVVRRHVDLLCEVLTRFAEEPATGVDAGYTARTVKRAPMAGMVT